MLATPYDGSMAADRRHLRLHLRWIDHLITSVAPEPEPAVRSGYVVHELGRPGTRCRC